MSKKLGRILIDCGAMINPRNIQAIDARSFASSCEIAPWVAPEVRIFEAMERGYDIPRRMRLIAISRSLTPRVASAARDTERREPAQELAHSSAVEAHGADLGASDHWPEYDYGRSWVEVAEEMATGTLSLDVSAHRGAGGDLASQLCLADDKDAIARAALSEIPRPTERSTRASLSPQRSKSSSSRSTSTIGSWPSSSAKAAAYGSSFHGLDRMAEASISAG